MKPNIFKYFYNNNLYYGYGFDEQNIRICICNKLDIQQSDLGYNKGIIVTSPYQINSINRNYVDYYNLGKKLNVDFKKLSKMSINDIMKISKINYDELLLYLVEFLNVTLDNVKSFELTKPLELLAKLTLNKILVKTVKLNKSFNLETKEEEITYSSRIDEWKVLIKKLLSRDPTIILDFFSIEDQINNLSGFVNKLPDSEKNIKDYNLNDIKLEQDIKSLNTQEKVLYLRKLEYILNLYNNKVPNTYYFINANDEYLFKDFNEFKNELDKIYHKLISRLAKSYYKNVIYDQNTGFTLEEALYSYEGVWLNDYKI